MFKEEIMELKFESNKGRDEFIEDVLNSIDNKITSDELNEISKLFNTY